ncbi:MAG: choice-of-anchor D domain-containing protein [Methanomassiliicoccales archaeon]|nr:choice-of-anchor D domain-containing protein [Methanomassiliicoccales archaeon]NYT14639.1 choice-of-anchor D domain-containing protein [Methanomassiliicoccales archaeon]
MNKSTVEVLLLTIILLIAIPQVTTASESDLSDPVLAYSPTSLDFGTVAIGYIGSQTFEIWNDGGGTLDYTIAAGCGWRTVSPMSGTSTGEHDTITVTVNTGGLSGGTYSCTISISSNGGSGSVSVHVIVLKPILSYSPTSLDFGSVALGYTGSKTFEMWNSGEGTLEYSISESCSWITSVSPSTGTSTGEHDTITVSIDTSGLSGGSYNYAIPLNSNGGSGTVSTFVTVQSEPDLSYSPTSLDFGTVAIGYTGSKTFEVWNSGDETLEYSISESCSWITSVSPSNGTSTGEHDTITVSIDTGGLSSGSYNYAIPLNSNGGSGTVNVYVISAGPPLAPQNPQVSPGDGYVNLTWDAPSDDGGSPVTGYKVYRGTSPGGEVLLVTIGDLLFYNDTAVTNGQIYYYLVSAVNSVGEGPNSSEIFATPSSSATVPTAPQDLEAERGNAQVTLSWSVPASDGGATITNYSIYRGDSSGSETLLTQIGTALTYVDTGLTNGLTYYYKVSAVNSVGEGPLSNEAYTTPATTPTVPQNLQTVASNGSIELTWFAPTDDGGSEIINYSIYRGASSGTETYIDQVGAVLSYTDTGLTNGVTYYYQVSAVNAIGESYLSDEVSDTPTGVPSAPQNPQVSPGDGYVNLTWVAPSDDGGSAVIGYEVYRGTISGGEVHLATIGDLLFYNDTAVTNDQIYYYKMSAVNSVGEGPNSTEVYATPSSVAAVPTAPQDLEAERGNTQVTLSWSVPASDGGATITNYKIYRGTASGEEILLTSIGDLLTFVDEGLSNGQIYYYKVSAVNSVGEGPLSNEASAIPATVPTAPQNPQVSPGDGYVNLTWDAPSDDGGSPVTGYKVYRGTSPGGEVHLATIGDMLFYNNTAVTNDQIYYYLVSAVNSVGEGPNSSEVSATPSSSPTVPTAPQDLEAERGDGQITLTWTAPSNNGGATITGYLVYRGTSSGEKTLLASLDNLLTYTDHSVANGQIYYYQASAVNSVGEGPLSNEASAIPATTPSAPQNLQAGSGDTFVNLTWEAPSDDGGEAITNYSIYRGTSPGSETYLTTIGNVLAFTDTDLINGQTYYYQVYAVNNVGEGDGSEIVNATPATIPSAPQDPQAEAGDSYVLITWSAPSDDGGSGIEGYNIYRNSTETSVELLSFVETLSYNDTSVTNGITYYYQVSAINSIGEGPVSSTVNATPEAAIISTAPSAPQDPQSSSGDEYILITWTAPSDDGGSAVTSYNIYRGIDPDNLSFLASVTATETSYNDTSVESGQTYCYRITAANDQGESSQSPMVVDTPEAEEGGDTSDSTIYIFLGIIGVVAVIAIVGFVLRRR